MAKPQASDAISPKRAIRPSRLGHVPALDGLRGAAIAVVVLAHATGWPRGGYLGVDLFFVLSGFLITTLLLEEYASAGRISIRDFYVRRARRLLPALFLLLGVYGIVEVSIGRDPTAPVLEGIFYCSNLFIGRTDPLTPLWSLAQEEQFYLLWPLGLAWLLNRRRRPEPLLISAFAFSTVLALVVGRHNLVLAAYSPLTRADGLIVGSLVASLRFHRTRALRTVSLTVVGVGLAPAVYLIGTAPVQSYQRFIELPALTIVFGAAVLLAVEGGDFARSISLRWLVRLGAVSYSLYLWHQPIFFAFHARGLLIGSATALLIPLTVIVAWLSTRYVEQPFRRRRTIKTPHPAEAAA